MNTKPKRKYGSIRPGVETSAGANEDVFDKFFRHEPRDILSPLDNVTPLDRLSPGDEPSSPANLSPDAIPSAGAEIVAPAPAETAPDDKLSPPVRVSPDDINPHQWTGVPNDVLTKVKGMIKSAEWSVFTCIYRETRGYHRDECLLSKATISRACMMSERNVPRITKKLAGKGLIEILRHDFDNEDISKRGTWYRMLMPGAALKRNLSPPDKLSPGAKKSPQYKEKALKKDSKSVVCDLCKDMNGMVYGDPENPSLGVKKCTHGEGK